MYKCRGNCIIVSNSHMFTRKILKKEAGMEIFYRLRIIFFRLCPLISKSTGTESYVGSNEHLDEHKKFK